MDLRPQLKKAFPLNRKNIYAIAKSVTNLQLDLARKHLRLNIYENTFLIQPKYFCIS